MIGMNGMILSAALAVSAATLTACATKAQTGAAIGGASGAAAGAIIGHQSGHKAEGAIIGGVVGAAGGYMVGNEMDKADARKSTSNSPAADQSSQDETVTINITNSNGSITPVTLRRRGDVWIGPRGEQYSSLPSADQLKPVYGF
ncbi:MAG: hypothetical protein Kow0059_14700 [Candidatus Sumerlaeia bacterium]